MRAGQPTESVCESLGLHRGQFHFIRRSNARPDVQILFRTMMSGMGGTKFPELDWVLREKRKMLIFCRTIHLGYRVKKYLCKQSDDLNADLHIRLYNALNWSEFNAETRRMMEEDADCLITIGTDMMAVGVDLSCVEDVIVIGEPEDVDDLFQKFGRVGCNKVLITNARAILEGIPALQNPFG
jgi:superfamily II DNA/RNA helicase